MQRLSLLMAGVLVLALLVSALPAGAASGAAAYYSVYATAQQFEHGLMIWQSDTGLIRVLYSSGHAARYPASYYGSLPDNPYFNVPPGRVRPINGFGRVWGNNQFIRNTLGWAVLPEIGFQMDVNTVNHRVYLTLLNGSIIEYTASDTWRYVDRIPSPLPDSHPQVVRFSVNPNPVVPGGSVQAVWTVANVDMALIEVYAHADADEPLILLENLPLDGNRTIKPPDDLTGSFTVKVWAANRHTTTSGVVMYERLASETITVDILPRLGNTTYTQAAYQRYENGFMIWRADTGAVIVFGGTGGGPLSRFPEHLYGPLPDNPFFDVPPGRVRPINGFGRVWGNYELVRRMLGWALGPEEAYTLKVITGVDGSVNLYTLPDGREAHVTWPFWQYD